ncbi:hypothetical protein BER44_003921 [Clostridioides difficile]|nr:hypothetical protein BER44_003921 [Clostridioides difficile]
MEQVGDEYQIEIRKTFLYEVVTNPNLNVEVINKNSAYQQMYKKNSDLNVYNSIIFLLIQKLKLLIQNNHSILTFINMSKFI